VKQTTRHAAIGALASLALLAPVPMAAHAQGTSIEAELQELKKGQAEIKRELEEIRKLLAPKPPQPQIEKIDAVVAVGRIPAKGRKDAPLTLIEFSDYQCPFCKRHVEQTVPELVKQYVDTGKARYVFRDFPLTAIHPQASKAAEAARCAGDQGKYWEMHDRLFANQKELAPAKLPEHATAIGLDGAKFQQCLDSGKYTQAVQNDIDDATKLGMRGTPTVIVGTTDGDQVKDAVMIRGAHPLATFKTEIDKLLAPPTKQ
jgi:protein-disulfide isomerase